MRVQTSSQMNPYFSYFHFYTYQVQGNLKSLVQDGVIHGQPFSYIAKIEAQKNLFALKRHGGAYASWNDSMTPEVEDPLLDYFVNILLDSITIYEHQVRLAAIEVSGEMRQLTEEGPRFVKMYFLLFVDFLVLPR